jgi:hypothetical protein
MAMHPRMSAIIRVFTTPWMRFINMYVSMGWVRCAAPCLENGC